MSGPCDGPLVWHDAPGVEPGDPPAAILECGSCSYIIVTGSCHDDAHATAPVLR